MSLAQSSQEAPRYDPLEMIPLNKSIMAFNIIWLWEYRSLLRELLGEMRACGMVRPIVDKEFPFSEAVDAVNHLKSGKTIGKVVIKLSWLLWNISSSCATFGRASLWRIS